MVDKIVSLTKSISVLDWTLHNLVHNLIAVSRRIVIRLSKGLVAAGANVCYFEISLKRLSHFSEVIIILVYLNMHSVLEDWYVFQVYADN